MKQRARLFIACAFLTAILYLPSARAQSSYSTKDSLQVFDILDKAETYFEAFHYDSAFACTERAIALSRRLHFLRGEAMSIIKTTDILIEKTDIAKAAPYPAMEDRLGTILKDSLIKAIAYLHTAQVKMYNDDLDAAIPLFQKALKTKLDKVYNAYSAVAYNDLGYSYGGKGEYQLQADNLVKALNIYEKINDNEGAAMVLNNISSMYHTLGDFTRAVEYQKKSIEKRKPENVEGLAIGYCNICQMYMKMGDLKEAERYQQLCVKFSQQSKVEVREVMGYITSGLLANARGNNKEAYEFEKKVIDILEKSHSNDAMLDTRYIAAAIVSGGIEDSTVTLAYFQKALDLAKKLNLRENLKSIYFSRTVFYKEHKNYYEAYENFKKYILYKDSLNSEETKRNIAEIETRYQTEKKDNEITRLNTEQKIKQLEIEKQKAVIAGNLLQAQKKQNEIDLLAKSTELLDIKIKQQDAQLEKNLLIARNNEQALKLAGQEKLINEQQLKDQKQVRNILIGSVLLLAALGFVLFNRYQLKKKLEQQKELLSVRNNIAKDLHDEIGSTLTSIKILSEVSQNNISRDQQKASVLLKKITEQSSQMQQGMSDIIWAIKPDNDKLENMVIRMREYVSHTLESKNIRTQFDIDEQVLGASIGMEQRRDLFLVFKEAVNNAAKYSNSKSVQVKLLSEDGIIKMVIADDGIGFETGKVTSSNGLKNMQARAAAMQGKLDIVSAPGRGTSVTLEIPAT